MDKRVIVLQALLDPLPHIERHNIRPQRCKEDPGAGLGRASACGPTYSSGGMISVESPSSMENGLLAVASMNRRWHARVSNADMDIELTECAVRVWEPVLGRECVVVPSVELPRVTGQ